MFKKQSFLPNKSITNAKNTVVNHLPPPLLTNTNTNTNNIPILIKKYPSNVKELLYITSAIVGVVCAIDSYFISGKELNCQRLRQFELVQQLNEKDTLIFNLIITLNSKIDNNESSINKIEENLISLKLQIEK